jgi:hypothetical protein
MSIVHPAGLLFRKARFQVAIHKPDYLAVEVEQFPPVASEQYFINRPEIIGGDCRRGGK